MSAAERKIIEFQPEEGFRLKTLAEIGVNILPGLASNYSQTWANSGIEIEPSEALKKISLFNPNHTYIFPEPSTLQPLGQIHTFPEHAESIKDFIQKNQSYGEVEKKAENEPAPYPNFVICFSLNCRPGYFVKIDGKVIPLPEFVVKNFPAPEGAYKIGFSFVTMENPAPANGDMMMGRYKQLITLENTRKGGPAMMHEAFGGIVVAFLPNARPEHKLAGGGITLVVYPKNDAQAEYFERVKTIRREKQKFPFERFQNTIILKDMQLHIPLRSL